MRNGKRRVLSIYFILENFNLARSLLLNITMSEKEKIIIVDESGFSRICLSILRDEGFPAEVRVHGEMEPHPIGEGVSLLITSYPYGKALLNRVSNLTVPVIILVDHVGKEIIDVLEELENSYCMVKPIDYRRFTLLVKNLVHDTVYQYGGYSIV